jgi:DNA-binding transcriptional LysR family regulator
MLSSRTGRPLPFVFEKDGESLELSFSHRLVAQDTNSYVAAGLAGLGIIQAPAYGVQAAMVDGRLVPLLTEWRTHSLPIHVIYPPNRYLSAKVRVFIDWVVSLFERDELLRRELVRV